MKAEYKKVSDLLVLESEETLQAFEMIELKGGVGGGSGAKNESCPIVVNVFLCKNAECKCIPKNSVCGCAIQPPTPAIISCTIPPID